MAWQHILAGFGAVLLSASRAEPASFSCSFGQPACLDYGDKVCNSTGKCVNNDAVCFKKYTCDFNGFACKSDLDEVAEKHDAVVRKYNTLIDAIGDVQRCVNGAGDVDNAQSCFRRLP